MERKKVQQYNYIPGDLFVFPEGFEAIVLEVDENHDAIKLKALYPDPELGKHGWMEEDGDWVCWTYEILTSQN